jgi:hypothetical protein
MTQDQFYRTTIQILRQLRIPFVDPCDTNYTGDCICGSTGTSLNGLFSIENNDLPIGLSSFRVPNQLSIIGGTSNSQLVFEEFVDWGVFAENFELEGSNNVTITSGATMDLVSQTSLLLNSPILRLNDTNMPTGKPVDEALPPSTYLRVVDQDGELAGTNGWLGISDLGGAGGIFDAANDGQEIQITSISQSNDLGWNLMGTNLSFAEVNEFKVETGSKNSFTILKDDLGASFTFQAKDNSENETGTILIEAKPDIGVQLSTETIDGSTLSRVLIGPAATGITIETPDDQTIKVGSNTYFERGEAYAKMVGDEQRYIEINNEEEYIELYNTSTRISVIPNEVLLSTPTSNILLTNSNARFYDNSSLKRGFQLDNFGENPTTGIGGDYSTLAPNSLVPKAYVDAQRPYKVYTALLTQTGTGAPVATVLENTLGGTPIWSRIGEGDYNLTLSGVFTENKVFFTESQATAFIGEGPRFVFLQRVSNDIIKLNCHNGGDPTELSVNSGGYEPYFIEIRVYN